MTAFTTRERRRLERAHENGYLDATCRGNRALVKAYGLWCWRLKVPMVWFERSSPHSRFATVRLDMFTTPNMLTAAGQAVLDGLGEGWITAHDAAWRRTPRARAGKMAHAAFRAAVQAGHYRSNRSPLSKIDATAERPLKLVARKRASA
jgi:hypothetical protein